MKAETTFKTGSLELDYLRGPAYNRPSVNERTVEVPLGWWFVERFQKIVEIGCVLPYYGWCRHTVIDLFDSHPMAIHANALRFSVEDENVLSISTVEHFEGQESIWWLEHVIAGADHYLITFPAGVRRDIEQWAGQSPIIMERNEQNEWTESKKSLAEFDYGKPFPLGNAIGILTNCDDLLSLRNLTVKA